MPQPPVHATRRFQVSLLTLMILVLIFGTAPWIVMTTDRDDDAGIASLDRV